VEAIRAFQQKNGLSADGIAGYDTQVRLYSDSAVMADGRLAGSLTMAYETLKKGMTGDAVKSMQNRLIELGYLSGTADGVFGAQTYRAVREFQKDNALYADGIAGNKTIAALNNANGANNGSGATNPPSSGNNVGLGTSIAAMARSVKYEYWYSTVRNACRKYPYCTLFDPESGISWQVHMFSYGKHAEIEPLTAGDTEKMYKACGYQKWTPKPVWVIFADGTIRIATTHSVPHEVQHRTDNNFAGHACLHFPRTMAQVTSIGPYATKHQNAVDKAWAELQASLN
jgi:peptidoglycan hydrolase-like protein with peptidoglycan-binding domain